MATFYVNIENKYRDSGNGTSDHPMNWYEFLKHIRTHSTHNYLLSGKRELDHTSPTTIHLDSLGVGSYLDSSDLVSPWVIILGPYTSIKTGINANPVYFKNGIIHQLPGSGKIEFCWQAELPMNLFNMYLIAEGSAVHNRLEGSPLKVYGCSIISTNPYGSWHLGMDGTGKSHFKDTVISNGSKSPLQLGGSIIFDNCVFRNPHGKNFSGGSPKFTECQFGWESAADFPTGHSDKEDFADSRIFPFGSDNAITIPSSGSFKGYEQGLFGGKLRNKIKGIGSFYFGTLEVPPQIKVHPSDTSTLTSSSATFTAKAIGIPNPTFQWRKDGVDISGATSDVFTISNAVEGDAGIYDCVVSNSAGKVISNPGKLTVVSAASFVSISESPMGRMLGESVKFSATVLGMNVVRYQWLKNDEVIPDGTETNYNIPCIDLEDYGTYSLEAFHETGKLVVGKIVLTQVLKDISVEDREVYTISSTPIQSVGFFDVGDDEEDPNHRYMAYIDDEGNLCLKETIISTMTLKAHLGFGGFGD